MVLSPEEDQVVYDTLLQVAAPSAVPRNVIVGPLKDITLQGMIINGEPGQMVRQAITLCLNDGTRLDEPAIVRLLRSVELIEPRIAPIIERLLTPTLTNQAVDPFGDTVLAWNVPFLERVKLRQQLKALLGPRPVQPFIVVNGTRHQGKSYTAEFINHVLQDHPGIMPAPVALTPKQGSSVGPAELASDIVARIGGLQSTRPEQVTNLDRWIDELVTWVTEAGRQTAYKWWIVLDGFNADELRPDTAQFIGKLAKRIETGLGQLTYRLILLDFDRTKLNVLGNKVAQDTTAPVSKANVQSFIQLLLTDAQSVDVVKVTDKIMTDLPDPVTELDELNQRLTDLIGEVRA